MVVFNFMKEVWKDIPNYEGIYQVSNFGNVKSFKFGKVKILKKLLLKDNYHVVRLCLNGQPKTLKIHQLVAVVFLNHIICKHKLVVNHINFIRTDNRVKNLEIVTQRENTNKKHIKSSSKYVGVHFHKQRERWQSRITINGKQISLGLFKSELEAHNAYQNILHKLNDEEIKKLSK